MANHKHLVRISFKSNEPEPLNQVRERIKQHLPEALPKGCRVGNTIRTTGRDETAVYTVLFTLPKDVLLAVLSPGTLPGTTLPGVSPDDSSGSG
jgi:hypothetical protein